MEAVLRRQEQFPGCKLSGGGGTCPSYTYGALMEEGAGCDMCPSGMAMWTSYGFRVISGKGGAVATSGPLAVAIRDTVFRTNAAPKGASLSFTASSSLRITNTTIDEPAHQLSSAVHTVASAVATCAENPCEAGSKCTFKDFSTFCEPCGDNEMGTDGVWCLSLIHI